MNTSYNTMVRGRTEDEVVAQLETLSSEELSDLARKASFVASQAHELLEDTTFGQDSARVKACEDALARAEFVVKAARQEQLARQ
jgi:hypothetical protein